MTAPIVRNANRAGMTQLAAPQPELPKIPRGWKRADGKTRHVTKGRVDIIQRDGSQFFENSCNELRSAWLHSSAAYGWEIIAYRVRKPVKNQGVSSPAIKTTRERKTVTVRKKK
jgi:hypothetical protein